MNFDIENIGRKSTRDSSIVELLKLPAIRASRISTIFLSSDPIELCDRLRLIIQHIQFGNDTNNFDSEIIAKIDKLLEYKCITPERHKKLFEKFNLLQHNVSFYLDKCLIYHKNLPLIDSS